MIKTKKALVITAIAVVAVMAGIVCAISFSTPVHGQATQVQPPWAGTCTGPDKQCFDKGVSTPSGVGNTQSEVHTSPSAQLGGGASVIPKTCGPTTTGTSCGGVVFTLTTQQVLHNTGN